MKFIPTFVHGLTDYLGAVLLFITPNLFGFADEGGAAVWVPRVIAVITLLQALMTNYELGVARMMPMRMHLMSDYVAGIVLAASPWIFGFANRPANAWMPHLIFGILIVLTSAVTERHPRGAHVAARA
jgi:hypothetical protein